MKATRRNVLSRILAAAGLISAGAAGRAAAAGPGEAPGSALELALRARTLETYGSERHASEQPARGERLTTRAELFDQTGRRAGSFHAAAFALQGPGSEGKGADSLELHTFELTDGTIVGSGAAGRLAGTFAVLGGTGRYATARGSYAIRRGDELDDGASFELHLVT